MSNNRNVTRQTTLFPDEIFHGILDEKCHIEFRDHPRYLMESYYDLLESDIEDSTLKAELKKLINKEPDFLCPYLTLIKILREENQISEANKVLENAYAQALNLIIDESGRWPGKLEASWIPNWHIIITIFEKAIYLWETGKTDGSLDLFRKLLKTNPNDDFGARNYVLGILLDFDCREFHKWVNNNENYEAVLEWFDENQKKFSDEFNHDPSKVNP